MATGKPRKAFDAWCDADGEFPGLRCTVEELTDEEGAHLWQARRLWLFADHELNVNELLEQRDWTEPQK
jgi:hypothetical protein